VVFKIDFKAGKAVLWSKTDQGIKKEVDKDYRPRIYIDGTRNDLFKIRKWITRKKSVNATCFEKWRLDLGSDTESRVLRVDVASESQVNKVVSFLKKNFARGRFRLYHVSISPQFRYCLQEEVNPRPSHELRKCEIELPKNKIADRELDGLRLGGKKLQGNNKEVLEEFIALFDKIDPDILLVNFGQVLELVTSELEEKGFSWSLGRMNRFEQLAGGNTIMTYGKTVHSSARYNIPGRIIVDRSNSFMIGETTIEGLWDLVERSWKPLQELAWGSIGNLLTAIEVKKAYHEKNILTPWKNWEGESPKKASTLHKADRGGFIFNPKPEIHEDVYEVDFASMYPNIMISRNISPETVNCGCCENRKVPELGYSICQKQEGFIPEVLHPLVSDRSEMKKELSAGIDDTEREKYVQGAVDAIKWLLVTCFGYMGHAHASYGAIECHQAINAYARQIMRRSKEIFEENGWRVEHGIIDSIWVKKKEGVETTELEKVCQKVSEEIEIKLEYEHDFKWVAFVPRADSNAKIGTLNRYFGKKHEGGFKTAGIEVEQSSTSKFIREVQKEMIEKFDRNQDSEDVFQLLKDKAGKLERGELEPEKLLTTTKTTKRLGEYAVKNRTVSALERAEFYGIEYHPGQQITYVVVDDSIEGMGRVKLEFEHLERYDAEYYKTELFRAAESILSPIGIDREEIMERVEGKNSKIKRFLN